jgi:hypothetical protein
MGRNTKKKLLFVYNADSGLINSLLDSGHKLFSPDTYQCNLCKLTYGVLRMRADWRRFIDSLGIEVSFLHRNEFKKMFKKSGDNLPAVYLINGSALSRLIGEEEMNKVKSLGRLIDLIKFKLREII